MRMRGVWALSMGVCLVGGPTVWAQQYGETDRAELAKGLKAATVSLEEGLTASEREGKPISGKFEVEAGKFQLAVYTMKGDKFAEVIVDHKTGKVAKVEPITGGEDLTAAKAQAEAMAKAKTKRSLRAAVGDAVKANEGYRAVSALPALKMGIPSRRSRWRRGTSSRPCRRSWTSAGSVKMIRDQRSYGRGHDASQGDGSRRRIGRRHDRPADLPPGGLGFGASQLHISWGAPRVRARLRDGRESTVRRRHDLPCELVTRVCD